MRIVQALQTRNLGQILKWSVQKKLKFFLLTLSGIFQRACGPNKALNCTKFYLCKHSDEIDQFDFKAHNDSFQNECEPGMECCEPRTEDQRVLKRIKKNDVGPYDKCGKRSPKGVQYEVKDFPNNRSQQGISHF